jgi:DhnA family fructose-bisphosphate aldolase class Ia
MLGQLGRIVSDASQVDLPVLALMYPRGENPDGSDNNNEDLKRNDPSAYAQLVAHAVRIGIEMGADIIKTQYTGSQETFTQVIRAAGSVPVLLAGGAYLPDLKDCVAFARDGVIAGAQGVCFGRNIFGREDPGMAVRELEAAFHLD